jgi:hypothetical protein
LHVIAFTIRPGPGCEPANVGLCRYRAHIDVARPDGGVRRLPTGLSGWSWASFCKTQYASDPRSGGIANFLRCHVGLVALLDRAAATRQVIVEVDDESGYWDRRDPEDLVKTVGDSNEMIAALAGLLKDLVAKDGVTVVSAFARFPGFEHLEAQGRDRLRHSAPGG